MRLTNFKKSYLLVFFEHSDDPAVYGLPSHQLLPAAHTK
jgi:hypothetical protein